MTIKGSKDLCTENNFMLLPDHDAISSRYSKDTFLCFSAPHVSVFQHAEHILLLDPSLYSAFALCPAHFPVNGCTVTSAHSLLERIAGSGRESI